MGIKMKTIIIYNSKTGFTKRYAEWISEALGSECVELREAKKQSFDDYDAIIFGGWTCAGGISKIKWFKSNMKRWDGKKLIVYCVGGSPMESPEVPKALRNNFSEEEWGKVNAFYCPGGFNYEKMSAKSKFMMKMFLKVLSAKKEKTEEDKIMIEMISHSYDIADKKYIEPIIACAGGSKFETK